MSGNKNDAKNSKIFNNGIKALAYGGPLVRAAANAYGGGNAQQGSSSKGSSNIMHYKSGSKGSGLDYGSANFKAKDFKK